MAHIDFLRIKIEIVTSSWQEIADAHNMIMNVHLINGIINDQRTQIAQQYDNRCELINQMQIIGVLFIFFPLYSHIGKKPTTFNLNSDSLSYSCE